MSLRRAPLRIKGHALTLSWSGEHGADSSSIGSCRCGWEESAGDQAEVRSKYRRHLERTLDVAARRHLDPRLVKGA